MKYLEYPAYQCSKQFTCGYAVIACLSKSTISLNDYDKSLGLTPRHQIHLLAKSGLYAHPVHFLDLDSLAPGIYIVNYLLMTGVAHAIVVEFSASPSPTATSTPPIYVMDPILGKWYKTSQKDVSTFFFNLTSILSIHDCNEPLYELYGTSAKDKETSNQTEHLTPIADAAPNASAPSATYLTDSAYAASFQPPHIDSLIKHYPEVYKHLGLPLFVELAQSGLPQSDIPNHLRHQLVWGYETQLYYMRQPLPQSTSATSAASANTTLK